MQIELVKQLEVNNVLGEGVIWDPRSAKIWWTDILNCKMYSWHFETGMQIFSSPEPLCSFGLTETTDKFICAFASGFAYFYPASEKVKWLCKVEEQYAETRMNDGRVDRQGRFWAGSMRNGTSGPLGALYCLDKNRVSTRLKNIAISNSLCWSPDAKTMYFADSTSQQISQYDFDPETGMAGNCKAFAKTTGDIEPDGSCIDSEGYLWNAQWGGGKVVRYDTQGNEVMSLDIPCKQPTCVAFGGPQMNHLFVTSATHGLNQRDMKTQLANGSLFVFSTPYKGLAEPIFAES